MTFLALFDCDGTLVDSQANICEAMEHAFAATGLTPPPRNLIRRIVGLSVFEAASALAPDLDEVQRTALAEQYKLAFHGLRARGLIHEPLYDGIGDLLTRLTAGGWSLGVATGKSDRGLNNCLAHHGIADQFVTLQTADRHPSKPHPAMVKQAIDEAQSSPQSTVMIGDTSFDMIMGRNAGCRSIGVSWGYHPADELRAAGAWAIAETTEELGNILKEMR
jgi:phosphoglycolate phosphatase